MLQPPVVRLHVRDAMKNAYDPEHECKPGESWIVYDAQGIYLCRVCSVCEKHKLSKFRPEILTGYDQSDVDEPDRGGLTCAGYTN